MFKCSTFGKVLSKPTYCRMLLSQFGRAFNNSGKFSAAPMGLNKAAEDLFRQKHLIPRDFRLVYKGGLDTMAEISHTSSAVLAFMGIGALYTNVFNPQEFPIEWGKIVLNDISEIMILNVMSLFFSYLVRVLTSRYVLRIYYNPSTKTYRIIKFGILPTVKIPIDFKSGSLRKSPTFNKMILWRTGIQEIDGQKVQIIEECFFRPIDYENMFISEEGEEN